MCEVRGAKSERRSACSFGVSALKFGFPVVGKGLGSRDSRPTGWRRGSVGGSGVWVGARKLEGERDVGGRRML